MPPLGTTKLPTTNTPQPPARAPRSPQTPARVSAGVTMLDTSVFGALIRGNGRVAQDLEQLRAKGEKIVVTAATYAEIRKTPNVVTRAVQLALIKEMGLEVQEVVPLGKRFAVYGGADPKELQKNPNYYKQNPNVPQGYFNLKVSNVGASDLTIVSDVLAYQESDKGKGRNVKLWTVERMARQQPGIQAQYKITFSPLSRVEQQGPFAKPEEVFALFPSLKGRFKVKADGRIVRTFWSGDIRTRIKTGIRAVIGGTGVKIGFKAGIKAGVRIGGLTLAALLFSIFAAKIFARFAQEKLDQQLEEIRPQIEKDIQSETKDALNLIVAQGQAFAVTTITISVHTDPHGGASSTPIVRYRGSYVSPWKVERHTFHRENYLGGYANIDTYITSTPITFDTDIVEMYKDYREAIAWYEARINDVKRPRLGGVGFEGGRSVENSKRDEERFAEAKRLEQDLTAMMSEMDSILQQ